MIESTCPYFTVGGIETTIAFYRDEPAFEVQFKEPEKEPFFAIVGRDKAMLLLEAGEADPLPNLRRDRAMRGDACSTRPIRMLLPPNSSSAARRSAIRSLMPPTDCAASRSLP